MLLVEKMENSWWSRADPLAARSPR